MHRFCANCDRETEHEIETYGRSSYELGDRAPTFEEMEKDGYGEDETVTEWVDVYYTPITCKVCGAMSLERSTEFWEGRVKDGKWVWDKDERVTAQIVTAIDEIFPPRMAGVRRMAASHYLPTKVRKIYEEALAAVLNRLPICAVAAIRATVEAICLDKSAKGRDLYHKIEWLGAERVIPDPSVAQRVRDTANWFLHEVEAPTEDELKLALQVLEDVLTSVYITKRRANGLPRKRPRRNPRDKG